MDHLRCKTPHRVRNEFYMHLLAYHLIRQTLAAAAASAEVEPLTISFKGALNHLQAIHFHSRLADCYNAVTSRG